jgi:hypothetical protein
MKKPVRKRKGYASGGDVKVVGPAVRLRGPDPDAPTFKSDFATRVGRNRPADYDVDPKMERGDFGATDDYMPGSDKRGLNMSAGPRDISYARGGKVKKVTPVVRKRR